MDLLEQNETNGGEKENRGIKRKRRGKKTRVQKASGCALCENKESSQWNKNTQTGEEIFVLRATNQRAVGRRWHHRTGGVLITRGRRVHVGTKIQIRAKEIFVLRATKINVL